MCHACGQRTPPSRAREHPAPAPFMARRPHLRLDKRVVKLFAARYAAGDGRRGAVAGLAGRRRVRQLIVRPVAQTHIHTHRVDFHQACGGVSPVPTGTIYHAHRIINRRPRATQADGRRAGGHAGAWAASELKITVGDGTHTHCMSANLVLSVLTLPVTSIQKASTPCAGVIVPQRPAVEARLQHLQSPTATLLNLVKHQSGCP